MNSKDSEDFCVKNIKHASFGRKEIEMAEQGIYSIHSDVNVCIHSLGTCMASRGISATVFYLVVIVV